MSPLSLPRQVLLPLAVAALAGACAREGDGAAADVNAMCRVLDAAVPLDPVVDESSGLAPAHGEADLYWTHNDSGGEAELYAVRGQGGLAATVTVPGARNRDWEDLAAGPCPSGRCLYIGDIGDNDAARDEVAVYRIPEPAPDAGRAAEAERFAFTYPDGPRDAEALFVLPDGGLYVISKGRTSNIAVYRYPEPFRAGEVVEMQQVANLTNEPAELGGQITAADASPDGRWVAVRSYSHLMLYRPEDLLAGASATSVIDLAPLGAPQGEAVSIDDQGTVVLTSEASDQPSRGTMVRLRCSVDPAAP